MRRGRDHGRTPCADRSPRRAPARRPDHRPRPGRRGARRLHPVDRGRDGGGGARRPDRRHRAADGHPLRARPPGARAPRRTARCELGARWPGHPEARFTGLGARHGMHVDQSGRSVQLGADRRYTGPDCPPEMLDVGGIPQGDYAPVPWLLSLARLGGLARDLRRRRALRARRRGRCRPAPPPGRCGCTCSPGRRPPRGCARSCALPGSPRCCRSGPTATGRAATSTSTSATSRTTSTATAARDRRSTRS